MKIGFMGRGRLGLEVLLALLDSSHEVVFAITCSDTDDVGDGRMAIERAARLANVRYEHIPRLQGQLGRALLSQDEPDLIVAIQWRHVLGSEIVSVPSIGILNVHGGLLPRFRGNACQSWAILAREPEVGLTVHLMVPDQLDSGPVLMQRSFPLDDWQTVGEIRQTLDAAAVSMVRDCLEVLAESPGFRGVPQSEAEALYCYPRLPVDGELNWTHPADYLLRLIRAASRPYPGAYSWFSRADGLHKLVIYRARVDSPPYPAVYAVPGHVIHLPSGEVGIVAGDSQLIVPLDAEVDGIPLHAEIHFPGVRNRLGLDIGGWVAKLEARVRALESREGLHN